MSDWTEAHVRRFLWRAGFGATPAEAERWAKVGRAATLAWALKGDGAAKLLGPAPTVNGHGIDPRNMWGHDTLWLDRMVRTTRPLEKKMTLFWADHFACNDQDTPLLLDLNRRLRKGALGSFPTLLHEGTTAPAMLLFLSLAGSEPKAPNENFPRELMELFTLGKGYSERDVREAARAMTGWQAKWGERGLRRRALLLGPARPRLKADLPTTGALRLPTCSTWSSSTRATRRSWSRSSGPSSSPGRSTRRRGPRWCAPTSAPSTGSRPWWPRSSPTRRFSSALLGWWEGWLSGRRIRRCLGVDTGAMMAVMAAVDLDGPLVVKERLEAFAAEVLAGAMNRPVQRVNGGLYLRGLLEEGPRKSLEPLVARLGGEAEYQSMQQFLTDSPWDPGAVIRAVCERVAPVIEVEAWALDDTGFPKDGKRSPGVKRQYSGTLGKIGNCQIGVSVHAAGRAGTVPLGWALYLPQDWCDDPERRRQAKIPDQVQFQTKGELGVDLVERAAGWQVPRAPVLGDQAYGDDSKLRERLHQAGCEYVLAGVCPLKCVWSW